MVTFVTFLVCVRIACLFFILFYRLLTRMWSYALIIGTAGAQYAALCTTERDEIYRIEAEIVNAIEDPPLNERVLRLHGDFVMGDKINGDQYKQL